MEAVLTVFTLYAVFLAAVVGIGSVTRWARTISARKTTKPGSAGPTGGRP